MGGLDHEVGGDRAVIGLHRAAPALLVDREGEILWYQGGVFREFLPVPAIGDGFIAYIEAGTRRLVAALRSPAPSRR